MNIPILDPENKKFNLEEALLWIFKKIFGYDCEVRKVAHKFYWYKDEYGEEHPIPDFYTSELRYHLEDKLWEEVKKKHKKFDISFTGNYCIISFREFALDWTTKWCKSLNVALIMALQKLKELEVDNESR